MRDTLPEARHRAAVGAATLVAALGNPVCGDDGAGPLVLRLLEALGLPAVVRLERVTDPLLLVESWGPEDEVVLLDAAMGGGAPGDVRTLDARNRPLPDGVHPLSSHGLGLREAVALAREMGRLPRVLTVHAVIGTAFMQGDAMTEPVKHACERLARGLHRALVGGADRPA